MIYMFFFLIKILKILRFQEFWGTEHHQPQNVNQYLIPCSDRHFYCVNCNKGLIARHFLRIGIYTFMRSRWLRQRTILSLIELEEPKIFLEKPFAYGFGHIFCKMDLQVPLPSGFFGLQLKIMKSPQSSRQCARLLDVKLPGQASKRNMKKNISAAICSQQISAKNSESKRT